MSLSDLKYPEVEYRRTALKTVVCQLKFNPILRIGHELPVQFQESVRGAFPQLIREESAAFSIAPGPSVEALPAAPAVWRFMTEDETWRAGLAVNFLSLETTGYQHFPDFQNRFSILQQALESAYGIDHYTRVGLRYINMFTPDDFPGGWRDKFNPQLVGVMADPTLGSLVNESKQSFILAEDDWTVTVRHGTENGAYRLDIDHATEARVDAKDVTQCLRRFNQRAYQVFRWAISEATHDQMEARSRE